MLVQMFMRYVGDNAHVEFAGIDPVLCPSMGRGFKDGVRQSGIYHPTHKVLHIVGVGRSDVEARVKFLFPNDRIDGGDESGAYPCFLKDTVD
jgi:hypothetical protein